MDNERIDILRFIPSNMAMVMVDIAAEREFQNSQHGESNKNNTDGDWLAILTEEIGEVAQALLHNKFGGTHAGTLRDELVQVAAVAVQWLEHIDLNGEIIVRQSIDLHEDGRDDYHHSNYMEPEPPQEPED